MTIVEFIEARLDNWEQAARGAGSAEWRRDGINSVLDADGRPVIHGDGSWPTGSQADHIMRHDPARVLAQVAAMRAIVAMYERAAEYEAAEATRSAIWAAYREERTAFQRALEALAAIWQSHPDYDPAWEPTAA